MSLPKLLHIAELLVDKFAITTHAEAKGKALITGGYLILFPQYRGISIALNCKFYTTLNVYNHPNTIHILCPQWTEKELFYHIDLVHYRIKPRKHQLKNVFIEYSLQCVLQFVHETDESQLNLFDVFGIELTLNADDVFYNHSKEEQKEKKMGLGSSSALTVSLIQCLFNFFDLPKNASDLYHLCQLSHFMAQGKIGSGFDIATALFGSVVFRKSALKIHKTVFQQYLDDLLSHKPMPIRNVLNCMKMPELEHIELAPFMSIIMMIPDTSFGTKTPQMVWKLLGWKQKNEEECKVIWNQLNEANESIVSILRTIKDEYEKIGEQLYRKQMKQFCNNRVDATLPIVTELQKLRSVLRQIRKHQKQMSTRSDVGIVPLVMDRILNEVVLNVDCVVEGNLPGAGGFDAAYFLCVGTKSNIVHKLQPICVKLKLQILDL